MTKMNNRNTFIEQLMIEKISGTISREDDIYLDELLGTNAEIKNKWENIKASFEEMGTQHFLQNIDVENGLLKLKKGIHRKRHGRTILIQRLTIAASLLILFGVAAMFFFHSQKPDTVASASGSGRNVKLYVNGDDLIDLSNYNPLSVITTSGNVKLTIGEESLSYIASGNQDTGTLNTLVIPETQNYKLILSDGSEIWLNSLSQIKFPFVFSKNKREVWVKGEAYFKVAKNKARPFVVHTSLTDIQVLGTEFNVNAYDSFQIKTSLVNGLVNTYAANGKSILLRPGFQSVFSKANEFQVTTFDSYNELSWMKGIYFFQNSSLDDIGDVVYRWFGITLVFDNTKISSNRFTGALMRDKPLKEFLDNLALASNIKYRTDSDAIYLSAY